MLTVLLLSIVVFSYGRHHNGHHYRAPHTKCGDYCCQWARNENCDNVCCDNGDCACAADDCTYAKNTALLSFVEKIMKAAKIGGCAGAKVNSLKILSNKVYFSHAQCPNGMCCRCSGGGCVCCDDGKTCAWSNWDCTQSKLSDVFAKQF